MSIQSVKMLRNFIFYVRLLSVITLLLQAHALSRGCKEEGILINVRGTMPGTDVVNTGSLTMSK